MLLWSPVFIVICEGMTLSDKTNSRIENVSNSFAGLDVYSLNEPWRLSLAAFAFIFSNMESKKYMVVQWRRHSLLLAEQYVDQTLSLKNLIGWFILFQSLTEITKAKCCSRG